MLQNSIFVVIAFLLLVDIKLSIFVLKNWIWFLSRLSSVEQRTELEDVFELKVFLLDLYKRLRLKYIFFSSSIACNYSHLYGHEVGTL